MSFRHDSTGIDPDSTVMLMPDGWYTLKITEAEELTSKKGNDMILAKCSPVNEPQYKDASIWHYIVFLPKEQPGAGISVEFRKVIGVPYGGDDIVDADDWVGRKFKAYVSKDTYEGKTRNKIVKISSEETVQTEDSEIPF